MPTAQRRKAEQKKHQAQVWGLAGAALMACLTWLVPRTPGAIVAALAVVFLVLGPCARNGYVFSAKWYLVVAFMSGHALILAFLGWYVWPTIRVSPKSVSFSGLAQEKYDFSVSNQTDDDKYHVMVPIDVDSQPESNFDLTVWPSSADARPSSQVPENVIKYLYCLERTSKKPFVLADLVHVEPHQTHRFTLTHKSGPPLKAITQRPISYADPVSYDKQLSAGGTSRETSTMFIPTEFFSCHVVVEAAERRP